MSLTKGAAQAMQYEIAGSKKVNGKSAVIKAAEQLSTGRLAWIVVKRHKVGLLAIGNIILILNWLAPFWFDMILSVVKNI